MCVWKAVIPMIKMETDNLLLPVLQARLLATWLLSNLKQQSEVVLLYFEFAKVQIKRQSRQRVMKEDV